VGAFIRIICVEVHYCTQFLLIATLIMFLRYTHLNKDTSWCICKEEVIWNAIQLH